MSADSTKRIGLGFLAVALVVVPMTDVVNGAVGRDVHSFSVLFGGAAIAAIARFRYERPRRGPLWVDAMDAAAFAFVAYALVHLAFLGEPHPRAFKGFLVEIRFAVIWGVVRLLGLDLLFVGRALRITLVATIAFGLVGFLDYTLGWGAVLDLANRTPEAKYWKRGIPRLHSPVITPVGTGYFLYVGICAAAAAWWRGGRALPALALGVAALALPATLVRTANALAILFVAGAAIAFPRLRSFGTAAIAACVLATAVLAASGGGTNVLAYVSGDVRSGPMFRDGSAEVHAEAFDRGVTTTARQPLGFGFGHAGFLAVREGGAHPFNETYFVSLSVQAGIPAVVLVCVFFAAAAWGGLIALATGSEGTRSVAVAALGILGGVFAGSLFLPVGSTAWAQIYTLTFVGGLANEAARRG